jgi:hypothetical protein
MRARRLLLTEIPRWWRKLAVFMGNADPMCIEMEDREKTLLVVTVREKTAMLISDRLKTTMEAQDQSCE